MAISMRNGHPPHDGADLPETVSNFVLPEPQDEEQLAQVEHVIERIGARYVTDLRELSHAFTCYYEAQLDARDRHIAAVTTERDAARFERDELTRSLRALDPVLVERDERIAALSAQLTLVEDRAGKLAARDDELTQASEELARSARDCEALRARLEAQERELVDAATLAQGLRDEIADLHGKVTNLERRTAEVERERDDLAARIAEFKAQGSEHLREVQRLCEELGRRALKAEQERDDLVMRLRGLLS